VNDCLPHRKGDVNEIRRPGAPENALMPAASPSIESQRARGDAEVFARAFAEEPDLARLSVAAQRVLAMAAALFYQRGAVATSVRDITRACGLSPGALYKHFASKDDVLYELVRHGHERLERRIATALEGGPDDPVLRMSAFVRAYVTGHLVQPELAQVVRREYVHLSAPRRTAIVQRRRALRTQLTGLLRDGAEAGRFRLIDGDDPPTRVALMTLDMCSRTSEWYDRSRSGPPSELADSYVIAALRLAWAELREGRGS
jgi:AcrR family transcriptional regulator